MQCFARDYIENLVRVLLSTGKERWVLALQDRYHQLCAVNLPYFYLTLLTRTVAVSLGGIDLLKINAYTNCNISRYFRRFQQICYCGQWFANNRRHMVTSVLSVVADLLCCTCHWPLVGCVRGS